MHTPSPRFTFTATFLAAFAAAVAGYAIGETTVFLAGLAGVALTLAGGVAMALPGANGEKDADPTPPGHAPMRAEAPRPEENAIQFDIIAPAHAKEPAHPVPPPAREDEPAPTTADPPRYQPPNGWPELHAPPREEVAVATPRRYAPGFEPPGYTRETPTRTPPSAWARPTPSADTRYSPLGRGETRGVCSKCGAHLTLPSARPLRATCPACGHSKMLR